MLNGELLYFLNEKERKKLIEIYDRHPLADYIDWVSFFLSDDGNEMHFVDCIRTETDENNNTVYVLKEFTQNDEDYKYIYVNGTFQTVPV